MKFNLVSDLHIDHYSKDSDLQVIKNTNNADILIIAGDISNSAETSADLLKLAKTQYNQVLFVDGNHDHYNRNSLIKHRSTTDNEQYLYDESLKNSWVYLPKTTYINDNTAFIGCMGWYDFCYGQATSSVQKRAWERYMADARCINFSMPPDVLAKMQADILREKISKLNQNEKIENIVIVTHTLPVKEAVFDHPTDYIWNQLSGSFFCQNLNNVLSSVSTDKIKYWFFGHTHKPVNLVKNNINFVCNPRGYPNENEHEYNCEKFEL